MSILKCKMCGGDLDVAEEIKIVECDYCGTKQTVPNADNEKKINLFNRANRLRMASEFDKAAGIYENIIAEFPEESEAYWGLCLCNYGVEYVDDPATAKKIPTCHRASFESLQKDENYELALEYADVIAQKIYRDEAREIDRIMSEILAVSKNEKPYDVFICYKETDDKGERTIDSVLAYDIYDALTAKGFNVFFSRVTLEDKLGMQYEPYIFAALNSAKVMLSIGTKYEYFHAVWVKNEWSRFLKIMAKDKSKVLIPCYKDIDAYDMPDEFKGLQAQDLGKLGAVQDIVRGIEKIIGSTANIASNINSNPEVSALTMRGYIYLEDGDFEKADSYFDRVLDNDPMEAKAYVGKVLCSLRLTSLSEIENMIVDLSSFKDFERALRFAEGAEKISLERIKAKTDKKCALKKLSYVLNKFAKKKAAEEEREIARKEKESAEERERAIKEKEIQKKVKALQSKRDKLDKVKGIIKCNYYNTICVNSDGTIMIAGVDRKKHNVSAFVDITAITTNMLNVFGLKSDGTVVATCKNNYYGECNISSWEEIVEISTANCHSVGLKNSRTVVAVGDNKHGECDVNSWRDIVAVAAGDGHTVGLKSNGTVVAVGWNEYSQCNVSSWKDVIAVAASNAYTIGLKSDGTVVAVGNNEYGLCNVAGWNDIVAIAAGPFHLLGLKADGTVIAVGRNNFGQCDVTGWNDIVAIAAGCTHTVGLKADGTVLAVGENKYGQCNVSGWKLFDDFDNLEEERKIKLEEMSHIEVPREEYRQLGLCQHCGGTFKGFFIKKCTGCGQEKDY